MSYNKQETTSIDLELVNSAISSGVVNIVPEKKVVILTKCEIFSEFSTVGR